MEKHLRVLLIEDSEDDTRLILRELKKIGYEVEHERVEHAQAMESALERAEWDLILCDYSMPQFNALQALEVSKASRLDLPFIILSGTISEEAAVTALKSGAHDFMTKGNLARLAPAIQRELGDAIIRREHKRAEDELIDSEERFRNLFENSPVSIWEEDFSEVKIFLDRLKKEGIADLEPYLDDHPEVVSKCVSLVKIVDVNRAALEFHQADTKTELLENLNNTFTRESFVAFKKELLAISRGAQQVQMDEVTQTLTGAKRYASVNWVVAPGHEKTYSRVLVSLVDITERKQRELELETIASVSMALRTTKTLDEMLLQLLSEALTLVDAKEGNIWLYDPAIDRITLTVERGWDDFRGISVERGEGLVGWVMEHDKTTIVHDFRTDPRTSEKIRQLIPRHLGGIIVPLHAGENIIGALTVNVRLPDELQQSQVRALEALAEIGGSVIHRMRLHNQTIKQVERMSALRTIDIAISSSLDLRLSLDIVLEQVHSQLGVDAVSVLLIDPGTSKLEYSAGRGFRTYGIELTSLRLGEGYAGKAALENQIIHVEDLTTNGETFNRREILAQEEFVTYFAVPLVAKGEIKGVLEIFHRSPLKPDVEWLSFLDALGLQTAIAIDNALLFQSLRRSKTDLELAYEATIEGWSNALDLRDKETEGHTQRVTHMTLKLARAMNVKEEYLINILRGGLLHDIGKMGVPDNILLKEGPLNDAEWAIMRRHPQFALNLLSPISYLQHALDIPFCHHEKWDGTGYPRGLSGKQIPLEARLFAVADVWDALTSDRPYRKRWTKKKALKYIHDQSGKHFDPQVVEVFINEIIH
jgi:response regulator RpfG family c-di-GMP phosphodiesterase